MGMSIDEAISHLDTYSSTMGSGQTTQAQHEESKRVAIETMRKYQKIHGILNSAGYVENGTVYSYTYDEDSRVKHIRKVVENGNDDN